MNEDNIPGGARKILRLSGDDAKPLLQDLVTTDLGRLERAPLLYTALLTPQGKYLFDFFVGEADDGLFIDIHAERAAAFAQRLMMYRLRRKMEITASEENVTLLRAEAPGAFRDPRSDALGWRLYGAPAPEGAELHDAESYDAILRAKPHPRNRR